MLVLALLPSQALTTQTHLYFGFCHNLIKSLCDRDPNWGVKSMTFRPNRLNLKSQKMSWDCYIVKNVNV
jgi:hypothetical protein